MSQRAIIFTVAVAALALFLVPGTAAGGGIKKMLKDITWLGHASFRLEEEGKVIYIDPYNIPGGPAADLILITHDHYDHCSPEDVAKIVTPETEIITTKGCDSKVKGKVKIIRPGQGMRLKGVLVEAVPAYNLNKKFHPKENGWVGFIITLGNRKIYHAGDTDFIPEMRNLAVSVALLPVGGTYTMTAAEAAEAVNAFRPKVAVPMHYGAVAGSEKDAKAFKNMAQVPVEILQP